ncbi:hypothetical protein ACRALDRAFT_1077149 [Sodiomyces alcalophilus JCM 7366]|uniref:uncharacterized protein n=1 Tax=Sodiomyces alcalophilus JCM 7366 TaxID=591952 RepID=UPI0039B59F18
MGRRKIEIKPIKDDRNRSVTFLKRKGGLFKKAHELSVLCSVDVAVFIFGNNKKLYEYSSRDMTELITRYQYHGPPNEHKGPSDFNTKNDADEGEESTPQREATEPHMAPPQFSGQAPYAQMRQHDPSASPPINGMPFQQQHPGHPGPAPRGHTPQPPPHMGSRPGSRQDIRRIPQAQPGPAQQQQPQQQQPQPPHPPHPQHPQQQANGYAYMPSPPIYNTQNQQQNPPHGVPHHGPPYPYPPNNHPPHVQQYVDDQRRSSHPPNYPHNQQAPHVSRISASPPQPHPQQLPPHHHQPPPPQQRHQQHQRQHQHPPPPPPPPPPQQPHPVPHFSPRPPQPQRLESQQQTSETSMPAPTEIKRESSEQPPQPLLLTTDSIIKRPTRKQHSIFTPIDENRSILSQHLASFAAAESKAEAAKKTEAAIKADTAATTEARSQSVDVGAVSRANGTTTASPPGSKRAAGGQTVDKGRNVSVSSIPDKFPPPSRSSTGGGGASRPSLRLEIPDEPSDGGGTATAASEVQSPRNQADPAMAQAVRRPDGQASNMVLPPPSPSASALLSAGATGPPNPFARPPPQPGSNMNIDTPASALPSRFLNNDFLPSPSSFDTYWYSRGGGDSNAMPSPLNFSTPVVGQGPSFLREENATGGKRKSPDISGSGPSDGPEAGGGVKRARIES